MKISWVLFSSWQKTSGDYDNYDDVSKEMGEVGKKRENYFCKQWGWRKMACTKYNVMAKEHG